MTLTLYILYLNFLNNHISVGPIVSVRICEDLFTCTILAVQFHILVTLNMQLHMHACIPVHRLNTCITTGLHKNHGPHIYIKGCVYISYNRMNLKSIDYTYYMPVQRIAII